MPTILIARTDANSAGLLLSDADARDREFIYGERTPEGVRPAISPAPTDRQNMINQMSTAIGIALDTGATIASRGEYPVYRLDGVIKNNKSKDPTEHH